MLCRALSLQWNEQRSCEQNTSRRDVMLYACPSRSLLTRWYGLALVTDPCSNSAQYPTRNTKCHILPVRRCERERDGTMCFAFVFYLSLAIRIKLIMQQTTTFAVSMHSIKLTVRTCILQRWKTNGVCVCLFPPTCWSLVHFKVTCRSRNSAKGLRSCDVAMRNI